MSAFDGDPRVTNMLGEGAFYEIAVWKGLSGTVMRDDAGRWRAWVDGSAGSPQLSFATADEALRAVLGEPVYVRPAAIADVEAIGRDRT